MIRKLIVILSVLVPIQFFGCSSSDEPTLILCGGASNYQCPAGMYCELGDYCGGPDRSGHCVLIPELCSFEVNVVCGCDRKDYSNACLAAAKGISVLHDGPCTEDDA